ncbi:hypothetical protein EIN_201040 [Entamoeba invadens IP1]|uniref:EGF-like domain-containing protein n=1 Tax=Entamoeba invadens IP1 TaxID=370355 RepID=A0A0A1U5L7_ENTIV|nr:hypothetical protein EIN_201040 [Entamoeba invadens IP1]ELP89619.1 hypothetical protein EIN_201040 [Entamoeba invadens IP1]|eukprot:XP_004256390.1 hypothetical protein EIN_201040 [Entamoeba invadens IP1]
MNYPLTWIIAFFLFVVYGQNCYYNQITTTCTHSSYCRLLNNLLIGLENNTTKFTFTMTENSNINCYNIVPYNNNYQIIAHGYPKIVMEPYSSFIDVNALILTENSFLNMTNSSIYLKNSTHVYLNGSASALLNGCSNITTNSSDSTSTIFLSEKSVIYFKNKSSCTNFTSIDMKNYTTLLMEDNSNVVLSGMLYLKNYSKLTMNGNSYFQINSGITATGNSSLTFENNSFLNTSLQSSFYDNVKIILKDNSNIQMGSVSIKTGTLNMYNNTSITTSGTSIMNCSILKLYDNNTSLFMTDNSKINIYIYCSLNGNISLTNQATLTVNRNLSLENEGTTIMNDNTKIEANQCSLSSKNFEMNGNATLSCQDKLEINSLFVLKDNSNGSVKGDVILFDNTQIYIMGHSAITTNGNVVVSGQSYISKTLNMNERSIFKIIGTFVTDYNTTLIMQGNSMINSTQIITFYGNSSVFLNDNCTLKTYDSVYMNGNSSLEMNGTALLETQNVLYVTDNSTLLMDQNSKMYIGGFVKIYNAFEYQRPTDIRKYYKGGLKVYQGAFLTATNVTVIKGNLYICGISNYKEDIPKIEVDNFGCENGFIFFGQDSLIITHTNVNLSLCTLDVSFRTIGDIPLFITHNFDQRNFTITATNDFDLIYTDNVYSGSINGASKLLLNGKLTRIGSSEKIFCHLNKVDLSTKRWSYTEPYCPLGNDVDWYITPLYNVTSLLIENTTKSDTMVLKRHQKQTELYSDESATIFDTQISFYKTDNFVVGILANKVTEISTMNLSKNVLFISETNLYHEGITFRAGLNKNYTLTPILYPICEYPLMYNKTNHSCYTSVECSDTNCKYCPSDTRSCVQCHSSYSLESGKCVNITNCLYTKANRCLFCSKGYHLQTNGTCSLINNCAIIEFDGKCQLCNYNKQLININGDCIEKDSNILNSSEHTIVSCNKGFYINSMTCKNCTDTYSNSLWCENGRTTKCQSTSEMTPNGKCDIKICDNKNESNVRCSVDIPDCLYTTNNKCIECKQNYYIYNNTCQLLNDSHCLLSNTFGCTSCEDNFYLTDTQSCERCDDNCLTCISNSRKCLSCANDYFLANYKCETNDNLKLKCDSFSKSGGCVICKRGYYRVVLDCYDCDVKCETCNNNITCLSCNTTNYRTKSGDCLPQSSIVGCDNVTSSGCSKCSEHYFEINGNECDKCDENCKACVSQTTCVTCSSDMVLSSYGECLNISSISKCLEITNSQCTKCEFWNSPNFEKKYCETKVVWWVILISVLVIIVFLFFTFVAIFLITRTILAHFHQKEVEKTTTIFAMKLSNVNFILLRGGISVQSKQIDFNSDIEEMPVNEETKQTFCVGNSSKNVVKIQFTISSKINKLTIRFDPEIVVLKSGFACEFSLYLTPQCTCHITDTIQIVSKNIKTIF